MQKIDNLHNKIPEKTEIYLSNTTYNFPHVLCWYITLRWSIHFLIWPLSLSLPYRSCTNSHLAWNYVAKVCCEVFLLEPKTNLNGLVTRSVTVPGRFYLNWIQQRIEWKWKLFAESMFGPTGHDLHFIFSNIFSGSFIVADSVPISWSSYVQYYWMIVFLAELWEDRKSLI